LTIKKLPLQGIVFDFDGTLATLNIDFAQMRKGVMDLLFTYDVPLPEHAWKDLYVLEMITAGGNLISRYRPGKETEFIVQAQACITCIEIEAAQQGSLFDGTREMLRALKETVKTGVITRNCLSAVQVVFPDIHQYTHAVITREQTLHVKPHPEHLLVMLNSLGVAAAHAAMVGDHPMDIKIGKDVGAYAIGVLTGHSRREALEQAGADLILDAATEINAILA
jgi:phosphoglycolate phosphatase